MGAAFGTRRRGGPAAHLRPLRAHDLAGEEDGACSREHQGYGGLRGIITQPWRASSVPSRPVPSQGMGNWCNCPLPNSRCAHMRPGLRYRIWTSQTPLERLIFFQ